MQSQLLLQEAPGVPDLVGSDENAQLVPPKMPELHWRNRRYAAKLTPLGAELARDPKLDDLYTPAKRIIEWHLAPWWRSGLRKLEAWLPGFQDSPIG